MNTSVNVIVLTASVAFITGAAALVSTNFWEAAVSFVIGLLGIFLYEKLPPSTPAA